MKKQKKPPMTFAESMAAAEDKYGTYDTQQGHGAPNEWRSIFEHIMGLDEAIGIIGQASPLAILGFTNLPTWEELKKRYRQLMMKYHPDRGGDKETAQRIIAAYTKLKHEIKNARR